MYRKLALAALVALALAPAAAPAAAVAETPTPAPSGSSVCPAPRATTVTPIDIGSTEIVFFVENDPWTDFTCPSGQISVQVYDSEASAAAGTSPVASAVGPFDASRGELRVTGLLPDTDYWYRGDYRGGVTRSGVLGPVHTAAPSGISCVATFQTLAQWPTGFLTQVTVLDTGTADVHGWQVRWSFSSGETVTSMWSATLSQSGTTQIATNMSYNGNLSPGGSTTFGFIGAGAGSAASTVECVPA